MKRLFLTALLGLAGVAPLQAQSLFSAAGLGSPVDAVDGRSRALGGVGIGLTGGEISSRDPAALGLVNAPTAMFTSQPSWVDFEQSNLGESGSFQSTRFPSVGVAYPVSGVGMMAITFGAFLDQRFEAQRSIVADLASGSVRGTDSFTSDGGVSRLNFTVGRSFSSRVAAGLSVGRYSGRVVRRLVREFDEIDVDASTQPYQAGGRWSYSGISVTGGGSMQFGTFGRVAASVTRGGTLKATASEDTEGKDASYRLPTEFRVGGSGLLAPGLMVHASYGRGDWSNTGSDLTSGASAGAAQTWGGGIELTRATLLGRTAPLRLGYRSADLPFVRSGAPTYSSFSEGSSGPATESAFTGGLGMILNEQAGLILASVDVGVERGQRKDLTLTETFWRATLTLRVAGF